MLKNLKKNYLFSMPDKEKEVFAHKYADKMRTKLIEDKVIPFKRLDSGEKV